MPAARDAVSSRELLNVARPSSATEDSAASERSPARQARVRDAARMPGLCAPCALQIKDSRRRAHGREALSLHTALDLRLPSHIRSLFNVLSYTPPQRAYGSTQAHKAVGTSTESHLVV